MRVLFFLIIFCTSSALAGAQPTIISAVAESGIVVDGDLSDWDDLPKTVVSTSNHAVFKLRNWEGAEDLQFSYSLASDRQRLYLSVVVTDDVLVKAKSADQLLKSDHIEIWFDTIPNQDRESFTNEDDKGQLSTLVVDRTRLIQIAFGFDGISSYCLPENRDDLLDAIQFVMVPTSTGYRLECALSAEGFFQLPDPIITDLGALIDVIDADNPEKPAQDMLFSSSPERKFSDPTTFSWIQLSQPIQVNKIHSLLRQNSEPTALAALSPLTPLPSCYPNGYWEWDGSEWRFTLHELRPEWDDQGNLKFDFKKFYPQITAAYQLDDYVVVTAGYEDNVAYSVLKDALLIGADRTYGSWFDEAAVQDFGHQFSTTYGLETFHYADGSPGFTVTRIYFSRTGRGLCGAAEAYATRFYRIHDNKLDMTHEIESYPCMENAYRCWRWEKKGAALAVYEFEEGITDSQEDVSQKKSTETQIYRWTKDQFSR
ncbi:MAG: hypothetical protein B6244_04315 [Candidatus Cloacimonetes bacterium 4572_55]|nr:MAG: hypothetical protein B6244_04315 [Candidatus Cloacimonetes bacterium 4572_55]